MITTMEKTPIQPINTYLNELANADSIKKCQIENEMVSLGEELVPQLVSQMQIVTGTLRGIIAMTLIRIGAPAVDFIEKAAKNNSDFQWVADYLLTEIGAAA